MGKMKEFIDLLLAERRLAKVKKLAARGEKIPNGAEMVRQSKIKTDNYVLNNRLKEGEAMKKHLEDQLRGYTGSSKIDEAYQKYLDDNK